MTWQACQFTDGSIAARRVSEDPCERATRTFESTRELEEDIGSADVTWLARAACVGDTLRGDPRRSPGLVPAAEPVPAAAVARGIALVHDPSRLRALNRLNEKLGASLDAFAIEQYNRERSMLDRIERGESPWGAVGSRYQPEEEVDEP